MRLIVIFFLSLLSIDSFAQDDEFRFMFYNVENLFDTINQPEKRDEAFTPEGDYHWDGNKLDTKINHLYKAIMAVKQWKDLPLIGLCEIENRQVIEQLLYKTPLFRYGYKIVHQDSPDERGIDVALLYQSNKMQLLANSFINITFPFDTSDKTRDILYARMRGNQKDTLHIYINHWPSRYGGYMQTQPKRNYAAKMLAASVDSVSSHFRDAKILIAGDFNDGPEDQSIKILLNQVQHNNLTSLPLQTSSAGGTLKYRSQWQHFDQVIVSGSLLNNKGLEVKTKKLAIPGDSFLFQKDSRYQGIKPFRFLQGPKYIGGYSDHLPVFIDIRN